MPAIDVVHVRGGVYICEAGAAAAVDAEIQEAEAEVEALITVTSPAENQVESLV